MTSVARGSLSSHRSGILFVDPSMEYTVYRENLRLHVHETSEVIHEWYSIHGWSSVPWETDSHRNQTSTENRYPWLGGNINEQLRLGTDMLGHRNISPWTSLSNRPQSCIITIHSIRRWTNHNHTVPASGAQRSRRQQIPCVNGCRHLHLSVLHIARKHTALLSLDASHIYS